MSRIHLGLSRKDREVPEFILPLIESAQLTNGSHAEAATPQISVKMVPPGFRTVRLRIGEQVPLLPFADVHPAASEQYRMLRTRITLDPVQPRLILLSSPMSGDGKTVTAMNFAAELSLKVDGGVLLLDADLRRSAVDAVLGIQPVPGLVDILQRNCGIEGAIVRTEQLPGLFVLTNGVPPGSARELPEGSQWPDLCTKLRHMFRYVIIDSPPVEAVADYRLIQDVADAVILVVRPDHTNRLLLRNALDTLPQDKLIGVVLNCVPNWFFKPYGPLSSYDPVRAYSRVTE